MTDDNQAALVDVSSLVANTGGDRQLVETLFNMFLEDMPRLLNTIESQFEAENFLDMGRTAHGLKGSSAAIGAHGIMESARALEVAATDDRTDDYAQLLSELKEVCERSEAAIRQFLDDGMPGL